MKRARKIMRRSIFTFLKNYQNLATKAALLALPFSASILISQAFLLNSPSSSSISSRLNALFDASGFSRSSYQILSEKLSQTIACSIFTLPFTLASLLASKAYTIKSLQTREPGSSAFALYTPILATYVSNSLIVLSANATVFALFLLAASALGSLGFDGQLFLAALGALVYSIVLANVVVICNLALALSGVEKLGGYLAALKACVLIRGRASTALSLAVPSSLGLASMEALFQYRVAMGYDRNGKKIDSLLVAEALLISFLYSMLLVLDTVVNVMLYEACVEGFVAFGHEARLRRVRRTRELRADKGYDSCETV